jgi:Tfp pilus assembly protein PilX
MLQKMQSPAARRCGSALMVTLVLVLLVSLGSLMMARTFMDQNRQNSRRRDLWRAYSHAESGIASVQNWALHPNEFTPNTNLFLAAPATLPSSSGSGLVNANITFQTAYPNLYTTIHASTQGYTIGQSVLTSLNEGSFITQTNRNLGRIESISLLPPAVGDPVTNDFKIISRGRSANGSRREVLAYLTVNPMMGIKIPGALLSWQNVAVNGNAKVHWGEAWSKGNMTMQSQNQYSYLNNDTRAIWRAEGLINSWGGGWDLNPLTGDISTAMSYPNNMGIKSPWRMSALQTDGHFYQQVPSASFPGSGWPSYDYKTFKTLALQHGRYYSTDAAGNVYRDGIETPSNKIDFMTEFGHSDPNSTPYDLVFIDTINGTPSIDAPPAADGSNLATINPGSTQGMGLKTVMYMGANFAANGAGDPPDVNGKDPNGNTQSLNKIFLDGVLICAGTCDFGGNRGVYGSVSALRGWVGSGTPDIWYDNALQNGFVLSNGNVGSPFSVVLQKNYGVGA